jgi:hypothetical protein
MDLRQEAIIDCFGLEQYEEGKIVELATKEKIHGWYFEDTNMDKNTSSESLLKLYSIDEIEIIYSNAYNGQSSF